MPRSEYKTIIAAKPTISKIERFQKQRSLPSKNQALAAMATEIDATDSLIQILLKVIKQLIQAIKDLKQHSGKKYRDAVDELAELANTIIQSINSTKKQLSQ